MKRSSSLRESATFAAATAVVGTLLLTTPAEAQRSGFIIGFGLGPGAASVERTVGLYGISDRDSRLGLAMNFHIGGVIGRSLELYAIQDIVWHATESPGARYAGTGLAGIGVTYPLNASVSVKGAVGFTQSVVFFPGGSTMGDWDGQGILAGGRHTLNHRWAIDLDVMRTAWRESEYLDAEGSAWLFYLTLNVLSH